jgi:DNA-binding NarL/FixJ family response regulator
MMTAPSPAPPFTVVPQRDPVTRLTPREREVLHLMSRGHDNGAICASLFITGKTLERHVHEIFTKLDLPATETGRHRRVCAVLAWIRSPLSRPRLSGC